MALTEEQHARTLALLNSLGRKLRHEGASEAVLHGYVSAFVSGYLCDDDASEVAIAAATLDFVARLERRLQQLYALAPSGRPDTR